MGHIASAVVLAILLGGCGPVCRIDIRVQQSQALKLAAMEAEKRSWDTRASGVVNASIHSRVIEWCRSRTVTVNGKAVSLPPEHVGPTPEEKSLCRKLEERVYWVVQYSPDNKMIDGGLYAVFIDASTGEIIGIDIGE